MMSDLSNKRWGVRVKSSVVVSSRKACKGGDLVSTEC